MMENFSFALSDHLGLCETWEFWMMMQVWGFLGFARFRANGKWSLFVLFYVECGFYKAVQFE